MQYVNLTFNDARSDLKYYIVSILKDSNEMFVVSNLIHHLKSPALVWL